LPAVQNEIAIQCGFHSDDPQRTCCMGQNGHCSESADCCGFAVCIDLGGGLKCAVET
jgi:hypothetical protein